MHEINKSKEPNSLKHYRAQPGAEYDGPDFTPVKADIRSSLLAEQGYVCAYCMERIGEDNTKIEHWACQHANPAQQLSYKNLLACCKGNEGSKPRDQTCDTKKGGRQLTYSPANKSHQINQKISYLRNGEIKSDETKFNDELRVGAEIN
jgi:uncharacterized protein (TIGR02646 family)